MPNHRLTIRAKQLSIFPPEWGIEEVPDKKGRYVPYFHVRPLIEGNKQLVEKLDEQREVIRTLRAKLEDYQHQLQAVKGDVDKLSKENKHLRTILKN